MLQTMERRHREDHLRGRALVRVLILVVATALLLAGCVMPDGTVYTLPADAPSKAAEKSAESEVGHAQPDSDKVDTGLEAINRIIERDPDAHYGYFLRAERRLSLGDMPGAIEDYDRVLELADAGAHIEPLDHLRAYYFSAQARIALGDLTGAADDLGGALRLNPFFTDLYGEYRQLAGSAQLMDEKVAEYTQFAEESDSPGAADFAEGMKRLLLAQLTQSPDAFGPAVEALTAAIDADAELAAAYHARGIARIGAAALEQLVGTVHVGPDSATYTDPVTGEQVTVSREDWDADWELQQQLADAARAEAIEDLARAVELDPENAEFVHDLGVAHFAQQEALFGSVYTMPDEAGRDKALALFDRAVELDPEWNQAWLSRAIASLQWGRQDGSARMNTEYMPAADIAYADDGSIVVLYENTSFDRWDTETGELLESQRNPVYEGIDGLNAARLSPDGAQLVTADYDDVVRVWDLATGEETLTLDSFEDRQFDAVISADGAKLASVSRDTASVWDIESGELLLEFAGSDPIVFGPDGQQVIAKATSPSPDLIVLDAVGVTTTVLSGPVDGDDEFDDFYPYSPDVVAVSQDGRAVAALGNSGAIRVWDLGNDEEARVLREPGDFSADSFLGFSPDGLMIVASTSDGRTAVYDVETGEELLRFGDEAEYGTSEYAPTFSPDGTQVVSALPGGALNIRDTQTGDLIATLQRDPTAEEDGLEQSAQQLLQQAVDDANLLVEQEYGAGWPYLVRASASLSQAELAGRELDTDEREQIEADWQAFTQLSPDVRQDDWISYMPGQVRFSSPVAPTDPLMAGRIEQTDYGRLLVHEAEGFQLQIPSQGPTGRVVDIYVDGGPAFVRILDDFRDFQMIVMEGELGDLSAEEWLTEMLMEPGTVQSAGTVETEMGEAYIVNRPDYDTTAAILPIDGRIFYLSYTPGWMVQSGDDVFSAGYGLKVEPADEVVTEFAAGLSLLDG